ncbi:hypothetical protein VKT23_012714 [Stygiomarasmius scandens]|uniref:Uncharacterized protein n=1 Tax=Marasmiellus scandens TaxID=2682957 RepID=A0ABR1J4Z5_9AGAR
MARHIKIHSPEEKTDDPGSLTKHKKSVHGYIPSPRTPPVKPTSNPSQWQPSMSSPQAFTPRSYPLHAFKSRERSGTDTSIHNAHHILRPSTLISPPLTFLPSAPHCSTAPEHMSRINANRSGHGLDRYRELRRQSLTSYHEGNYGHDVRQNQKPKRFNLPPIRSLYGVAQHLPNPMI